MREFWPNANTGTTETDPNADVTFPDFSFGLSKQPKRVNINIKLQFQTRTESELLHDLRGLRSSEEMLLTFNLGHVRSKKVLVHPDHAPISMQ